MPDIILKNRDGKDITYKGVDKIVVPNADGGTTTFTDGSQLEIKTDEKYVNFFDYDGTLLAAYDKVEAAALTSLPEPPVHPEYGAASWNWTLESIKDALEYGVIDVGAIYTFRDTKLFVSLVSDVDLSVTITIEPSGGAQNLNIDWGDGTTTGVFVVSTSYQQVDKTHTYAAKGDYTITIISQNSARKSVLIRAVTPSSIVKECHKGYCLQISSFPRVEKLMLSDNGISDYANTVSSNFYALRFIAIPRALTSVTQLLGTSASMECCSIPDTLAKMTNGYFFQYSGRLKRLPNVRYVTTLSGNYVGQYCGLIKDVILPPLTALGTYMFRYCTGLESIKISEGTTAIPSYFAQYCYSLQKLILPRTISSVGSNFLTSVPNVKIYVPDDMVDAYKAMANLSTFADYIFPISEMPVE